jgi:uncharacterized protein YodC (DUF2158 family)
MTEIKAGDVVVLKSGGPKMTVSKVAEQSMGAGVGAWCQWFEKNKLTTAVFSLATLEIAD